MEALHQRGDRAGSADQADDRCRNQGSRCVRMAIRPGCRADEVAGEQRKDVGRQNLIEESARLQSLAEQIGGAQNYTPGALEVQWSRTGLWEKSKAYVK